MLELGHLLTPAKSKKAVTVRLVLSNADLVAYYRELFKEK